MPQFIYKSNFKAGQEATKRHQLLFEAEVSYAIFEGYGFIQDKSGTTFQIVSPTELVETDLTEEDLQKLNEYTSKFTDSHESESESESTDDDYCINCHNILAIDQVINNTLLQEGVISSESCDNMLKLAHLKQMLMGVD